VLKSLSTLLGRFRPGAAPKPDGNPYQGLRAQALEVDPSKIGIDPSGADAWGVIMDMGTPGGTATVVAFADGSASIYLSNGGGFIGGEGNQIEAAARAFVSAAAAVLPSLTASSSFALPAPGRIAFHVRTPEGVRSAEAAEQDLAPPAQHALSALFAAGQGVITQYRLARPR
jgi:hypothetical protein